MIKRLEKPVVTFAKPFASDKEQNLVFTDKEKVETKFAFTYTIVVSSLEATSTRVDDNTDKQFLGFTINGGES